MGRFVGYAGVVNHLGGKFTADARALTPALSRDRRARPVLSRRRLVAAQPRRARSRRRSAWPRPPPTRSSTPTPRRTAIDAALTRLEALARAPRRGDRRRHRPALEPRPHRALERRARGARRRARSGFGDDPHGRPARRRRPDAEPCVRGASVSKSLPYRRSAGVALINRAGEAFIGRRARSREATLVAGHEWQMPQGGIDEGEEPYAGGAARTLRGDQRQVGFADRRGAGLAELRPARGIGQPLARPLPRPDAEVVPAALRGRGSGDRHPPSRRRRAQARVRRLALGAIGAPARTGGAVQARGLRKGRGAVRAAGEAGVRFGPATRIFRQEAFSSA